MFSRVEQRRAAAQRAAVDEHARVMEQAVSAVQTQQLTCLHFGSMQLVDQDVARILSAVKAPELVTTLELSNNQIKAKGAADVAHFLAAARALTDLDMRSNQIGNQGLEQLVEALRSGSSLTKLDLRRNQLNDGGAELIASLLQSNLTIASLDLRNNNITATGVGVIAAAVEASGHTADINVAWLCGKSGEDPVEQRLATALEKNRNSPMVLTLLWTQPVGRSLKISCNTIGGREVASEQVLVTDTLASLKGLLSQRLQIAARRIMLILPDARMLEDASGTATLEQLLGL